MSKKPAVNKLGLNVTMLTKYRCKCLSRTMFGLPYPHYPLFELAMPIPETYKSAMKTLSKQFTALCEEWIEQYLSLSTTSDVNLALTPISKNPPDKTTAYWHDNGPVFRQFDELPCQNILYTLRTACHTSLADLNVDQYYDYVLGICT